MTYAKLLSPTSISTSPPKSATIDGCLVIGRLPADYLASIGYYPLETTPEPQDVPGYHYETRYAYDDAENPTKVVQSWVSVENPPEPEPPPREFSKRKLYRAFKTAGIWEAVKTYMEQNDVWEDWEYATTLDEDDPLMVAAISALQQSLGISQKQLDSILNSAVV